MVVMKGVLRKDGRSTRRRSCSSLKKCTKSVVEVNESKPKGNPLNASAKTGRRLVFKGGKNRPDICLQGPDAMLRTLQEAAC